MRETIPPRSAVAFPVAKGERFRVIDPLGGQVADVVLLHRDGLERFSQALTRNLLNRLSLRPGDPLFSTACRPMAQLLEDTCGHNDIVFAPCRSYELQFNYGMAPGPGCFENLGAALEPWGVAASDVPDPLNAFSSFTVVEDCRLREEPAPSKAGDYVEFGCLVDCVVGVSSCACEGAINNWRLKPIGVEWPGGGPVSRSWGGGHPGARAEVLKAGPCVGRARGLRSPLHRPIPS